MHGIPPCLYRPIKEQLGMAEQMHSDVASEQRPPLQGHMLWTSVKDQDAAYESFAPLGCACALSFDVPGAQSADVSPAAIMVDDTRRIQGFNSAK